MDDAIEAPPDWIAAAARVRDESWRKVLVLGARDVGKSTFCRFLSASLLEHGTSVGFVDADIGQKDLGPPAAVTLGQSTPSRPATEPDAFYFVGGTDPARGLLPLVIGTARLVRQARSAIVLVNSTGLIDGPGRQLKTYKIDAVGPDVLIAITRAAELDPILLANRHVPQLRLPCSPRARAKGDAERRSGRQRAFGRYFATAQELRIALDALILQRAPRPSGRRTPDRGVGRGPRLQSLPAGVGPNRLCGLADARGRGVGLGILETVDPSSRSITLFTPVPRETIAILQFGDMRLDRSGREIGPALGGGPA